MLPTVSASKIKSFKTCHRLYQYKYIIPYNQRPKEDKNIAALYGTALHKAIESKYRTDANPVSVFQETMQHTYDQWDQAKEQIRNEYLFGKYMKDGKAILKNFAWDKFTPEVMEYEFLLPFPNKEHPIARINGYIDMITLDGMVIDHKSTSKKPNADELSHDPQFLLYYWAYTQLYNTTPYKIIWNHLRTGELIEADITYNYDMKLQQLAIDIEALLQTTHFPRREQDDYCRKLCSFYTQCYGERLTDKPDSDTPAEDEV